MRANKSLIGHGSLIALGMLIGSLAAGEASAQCNSGCAPPPPPTPPSHPSKPSMPHVSAHASAYASAHASASASASGGATGSVYYGGGYGNWSQAQGIPAITGGLNVETGHEMAAEAYQASRTLTKTVTLQASCIDDKGVPHPASQVFGYKDVKGDYRGELYRCIAGTRLQYIADGKSYDCGKNDALWHEGGKIECRRQLAARACNERSLLRRFGAGVKILTITTTETYMASRQVEKKSAYSSSSSMVFDGGVGGFVQ
ncbi:hypothetical protein [Asticcacaulis endophyticus]|nr:hypothetical protein [Asticcacaulis endophyticus]